MAAEGDVNLKFTADFEGVKKELQTLRQHFTAWSESIKTIGTAAFAFTAAKAAIQGFMGVLQRWRADILGWVHAAETSELINVRLGIAVRNAGVAVGFTTQELIKYADKLSNVTIFSSDEIRSTERKLITMGVYGNKLKEIIDLSTQVSSVEGRALESTAVAINRAMGALASSDAKASSVRRMLAGAGVFLSPQELAAIEASANKQQALLKVLSVRYAAAAGEIADTGYGVKKALANIWGDIQANLGTGFLHVIVGLRDALRALYIEIKNLTAQFAEWIKTLVQGETATKWISNFRDALIYAFSFVEEAISRIPAALLEVKATALEVATALADAFDIKNFSLVRALMRLDAATMLTKIEVKESNLKSNVEELGIAQKGIARIEGMSPEERAAYDRMHGVNKTAEELEFFLKRQKAYYKLVVEGEKEIAQLNEERNALLEPGGHQGLTDAAQASRKAADDAARGLTDFLPAVMERYVRRVGDMWYEKAQEMADSAKKAVKKAFDYLFPEGEKKELPLSTDFISTFLPNQQKGFAAAEKPAVESIADRDAAIDRQLKKMAMEFKPRQESRSAIEDAASVFKRIQTSAASVTLSEAEKKAIAYYDSIKQNIENEKNEAAQRRKAWDAIVAAKQGIGP